MDVGRNKRVLSVRGVNIRAGILKYEAGGWGNSSVRRFVLAVFNRPIAGTTCVIFEGEIIVKLSKIFISVVRCEIYQNFYPNRILNKE
jgi:hypothetical protein